MQAPNVSTLAAVQNRAPVDVAAPSRGGAAFEALLEKLQLQANQIQQQGSQVQTSQQVVDAADAAKSSLDDALHLGDQLLEAYRAALHQNTLTISRSVA